VDIIIKKTGHWSLLFINHFGGKGSRSSVVGLLPGLQAGRPKNRGVTVGRGDRFFFSTTLLDCRAHLAGYSLGGGCCFPG